VDPQCKVSRAPRATTTTTSRFLGILHDMSHQDIQHFTRAIEEHIKQYGGRPYEIEFEEIA
jgi:hypothetical protein